MADLIMSVRRTLRLDTIYKPVNAEFCQLAFNAWKGCAHSCRYCYGPRQTHKKAEEFRVPQSKKGDIFLDLKKDLKLLIGKETILAKEGRNWISVSRPVPHVLLMSDCDPFLHQMETYPCLERYLRSSTTS